MQRRLWLPVVVTALALAGCSSSKHTSASRPKFSSRECLVVGVRLGPDARNDLRTGLDQFRSGRHEPFGVGRSAARLRAT